MVEIGHIGKRVKSLEEALMVIPLILKTGICSYDFETSTNMDDGAFYEDSGYITLMGISFQPGSSYEIPLYHHESELSKEDADEFLAEFNKQVWQNPKIIKVAWNIRYEFKWQMHYGFEFMKGTFFDGMLLKYLMDETRPMGLKPATQRFIPYYGGYDNENSKLVKQYGWNKVPIEPLAKYCGFDTDMTLRLVIFFWNRMDEKLRNIYNNLYVPATYLLSKAEFNGFHLDSELLDDLIPKYDSRISELENKLRNNLRFKKYERSRLREAKFALIHQVEEEIEEIEYDIRKAKRSGDKKKVKQLERKLATRNSKLSKYVVGQFTTKKELKAKEQFNFGSTKQLQELFYTSDFGFKYEITDRTDKGAPAVGEDALLALERRYGNKLIKSLNELRGLEKINTVYIKGFKEKLSSKSTLHGSFLLHGTETGRLSSKEPNLQQIPRKTSNPDVKKLFTPRTKKRIMIHIDYSAAEYRVVAGLARDKNMIEAFKQGKDLHLSTACKKYGEDYDEILKIYHNKKHPDNTTWEIRRKQAKTVGFGVMYGQGDKKQAESLSDPKAGIIVTPEEAHQSIVDFYTTYPQIKKFFDNNEKILKKQGYVRLAFGNKRRLPEITSMNKYDRYRAIRQANNSQVQGAASHMTLYAGTRIFESTYNGYLPSNLIILGFVHDTKTLNIRFSYRFKREIWV